MRVLWMLLALLFVVTGGVFGALNGDAVTIDFYAFQADLPKGAALLSAVMIGWVAAGATVWLAVVVPLQRRLARQRRESARPLVPGTGAGAASDA